MKLNFNVNMPVKNFFQLPQTTLIFYILQVIMTEKLCIL
jgi:hypothetical protein